MQAKWGTLYSFLTNGCELSSRTRLVLSDAGRPLRYVTRISVAGYLEGDSQSDISAQEAALRTALLTPYQDFNFLTDAGSRTALSLVNSSSLSGVRVVDGPSFPKGDGAEYATLRRFEFDVEAEFLVPNAAKAIVSFTESISITGTGGPVRRIRVPINTPRLVRQQISPASVVRATQTGTAVGHTVRPTPPRPLWPDFELEEQQNKQLASPQALGRDFVNFGVSWSYSFEADVPLVGTPNLFPV